MADHIDDILRTFERTTEQFLSEQEFRAKLKSGKQLRVKYMLDVKTPTLHIGHAVNLWLLRRLQDAGHKVVFLFADFTSRVGDTDGRLETIGEIPKKEVEKNIRDVLQQAKTILRFDDPNLIEVRRNSEWYEKMGLQAMMNVFSLVTHAKLMSRDMFQMRTMEGSEIYINEMLYPILQGYDSYMIDADVSIIGSDQLFSESIGRLLQEKHKKKPQTIITTTMTPGIDGRNKQSQKRDNDIALTHSARDKYGRIMSIPDTLIEPYLRAYTDMPLDEIAAMDEMIRQRPKKAKHALAYALVEKYHGQQKAEEEREWFDNTISKGYMPPDMPSLILTHNHMDAIDLVVLARPEKSKSDSRRLIAQGGIELNGRKLRNPDQELYLKDNDTLKVGKRGWFHIKILRLPTLETMRLRMHAIHSHEVDLLSAYIPEHEMAKYIGKLGADKKMSEQQKNDAVKKIAFNSSQKGEWIWVVSSKVEPDKPVAIAHLQKNMLEEGHNIWADPGFTLDMLEEAILGLTDYMASNNNLRSAMFKSAFQHAILPREMDVLDRAYKIMNTDILHRADGIRGIRGISKEGWEKMYKWRRMTSPWLFKDSQEKILENKKKELELSSKPDNAPKPS